MIPVSYTHLGMKGKALNSRSVNDGKVTDHHALIVTENLQMCIRDSLYSDTVIMLKACEIDFNNPPAKAQEIISAGDVPLGTQGKLFGITGGEGTGKSLSLIHISNGITVLPTKSPLSINVLMILGAKCHQIGKPI